MFKNLKGNFVAAFIATLLFSVSFQSAAITVLVETPLGNFEIELYEEDAPVTVDNFLNYIEDGSYDESFIHRSEKGFVIQGGSYTYPGGELAEVTEKSPIRNEFGRLNTRGTIAMAKLANAPHSATSSWFINLADNTELNTENSGYTVFGQVTGAGMEVVDAIQNAKVYNLNTALSTLPLINFSGSGDVQAENLIMTGMSVPDALNDIHDLQVTKTVNFPNPAPTDDVVFTIEVTNSGPEAASNVEVLDLVPAGMQLSGAPAPAASQGTYDPGTGVWQIGALTASGTVTLTLPVEPLQYATPECFVNQAAITGTDGYDPDRTNDSAIATVYVGGLSSCAGLTVTVIPRVFNQTVCPSGASDLLRFDIFVQNAGPDTAQNVNVSLNGTLGGTAQSAQNNALTFAGIAAGGTSTGTLSWAVSCPRSDLVASYTVTATSDTATSTDSAITRSADFNVSSRTATSTGSDETPVDSDDGGACFIATAAYGSYMDPHVAALRAFRDEVLLQTAPGRRLVALYYQYSPALANIIAGNDYLRIATRILLTPLVYTVAYPLTALLLLVAALVMLRQGRPAVKYRVR